MITSDPAEFAAALPAGGRLLGLDVGTQSIGTALCDAQWAFATPALLIRRTAFAKDLAALRALLTAQDAAGIVVGLPLNLDGSDSPRTQSVRAFAHNLTILSRPIMLWDERWSTMAVERAMIAADVSRAKRSQRVDNAAAAYILQGAIDAMVRLVP